MAIIIEQEPKGIYPAFNDSWIKFTSDLVGHVRAEIKAFPLSKFPKGFKVFPDVEGNYLFNVTEIARAALDGGNFEDGNFFADGYYKSFTGLYLLQSITIEVFNASTSETLNKNYEFFRDVKQIGEDVFSNDFQVLNKSKNGIDYNLTYFEGFPFHFDIKRIIHSVGKEITVKHLGTLGTSPPMPTTETGSFRINIDRGNGDNWTFDNFLPLIEGLNRLEVYEDYNFRLNLNLKKKKICRGVYLKWANSQGGYSHYLFDKYFSEEIDAKEIGFVGANTFKNVGEANSRVKSLGRSGSPELNIKTRVDENEREYLKDLYSSPSIQMYSSMVGNIEGRFIDISINSNFRARNKRLKNEVALTLILPELITMTL
jgi:hypothetical protein